MRLCINVVFVSLLICYTAPVYSKSIGLENCNGCSERHIRFDVCTYPADGKHADAALEESESRTDYTEVDLKEFHSITEDEIHYIQGIIRAERKVRCKHQLRKLKGKKLEDIMKISSSATENRNVKSNITTTYMKIATLTFLLDYLDSELAAASEECCLSYPRDIFRRLRNRILNKWYHIQGTYGESVDESDCNVCVYVDFKSKAGCGRIRDGLYLLLQYARAVLKHSNVVLKSVTPRLKGNLIKEYR